MEFDLSSISIGGVVALVGSTGILSAICTHLLGMFRDWRKDRKETKRAAACSAIRLAVILEAYALDCAKQHSEIHSHHSSDGHAGERVYKLPEIDDFPTDIEWKALDAFYSSRVLSFPNEIALWNTAIHAAWEYGDGSPEEDGSWECGGYCAVHGYKAWQLAEGLRKKYSISLVIFFDGMWNIGDYLKQSQAAFYEQHKKRMEENKRVHEELNKLIMKNSENKM